jgi:hypothetical protein
MSFGGRGRAKSSSSSPLSQGGRGGRREESRGGLNTSSYSSSFSSSSSSSSSASASSSSSLPRTAVSHWKERTERTHIQHLKLLQEEEICHNIFLIGSSMMERWLSTGLEYWNDSILPTYKVFNAGVGGDKTQNLLWRLEHGLISSLPMQSRPQFIILQIGSNNIEQDSATDVLQG